MTKQNKQYDVIIIGAGVTGTALLYSLSKYTDIQSIALIEKYNDVAPLNSDASQNSQTLHFGDIESNYTLEKVQKVNTSTGMIVKYCQQYGYLDKIVFKYNKMLLGIGAKEVDFIKNRYKEFKDIFPQAELWDKATIKAMEPNIILDEYGQDRPEDIIAYGTKDAYSAADYGKLSHSFVDNAKQQDKDIKVYLNNKVIKISKNSDGGVDIQTNQEQFSAKFVVVDAGAHSLFLAHQMGIGLNYSTLPVCGSYYYADLSKLSSKVYTVQNPKLPFAAIHGDPDVEDGIDNKMRLGPTALSLPKLERYKSGTALEFWQSLNFDKNVFKVLWELIKDSEIRNFILKNFVFEIPFIGKRVFLQEARKIIPSLDADEISYSKNIGGIRPQVIDKGNQKLLLGEVSLEEGPIIFNMTPSPGASSCLGNALKDTKKVCTFLNANFDEASLNKDLIA